MLDGLAQPLSLKATVSKAQQRASKASQVMLIKYLQDTSEVDTGEAIHAGFFARCDFLGVLLDLQPPDTYNCAENCVFAERENSQSKHLKLPGG